MKEKTLNKKKVYPEALSLMPFPYIWCVFFFLMMITIGLGSLLSLTECILDSLVQYLGIVKPQRKTLFRFGACMFFFFFGLSMTTNVSSLLYLLYLLTFFKQFTNYLGWILSTQLDRIILQRFAKHCYLDS